jgi:hypothetical protein
MVANPTKTKNTKQILAERALARAQTGLYFLEDIMRNVRGGTDGAYSRSRYILLAYNFELILNSLFILASKKTTREDIINELISASKKHDFEKLFNQIPVPFRLGINKVKKDESSGFVEYHIELSDKQKIIVQDLIDVRYDFKKDILRKTNPNEATEIKVAITALLEVTKMIINKNSLL